jgi:hypothetical protein
MGRPDRAAASIASATAVSAMRSSPMLPSQDRRAVVVAGEVVAAAAINHP